MCHGCLKVLDLDSSFSSRLSPLHLQHLPPWTSIKDLPKLSLLLFLHVCWNFHWINHLCVCIYETKSNWFRYKCTWHIDVLARRTVEKWFWKSKLLSYPSEGYHGLNNYAIYPGKSALMALPKQFMDPLLLKGERGGAVSSRVQERKQTSDVCYLGFS